jgi:hypothetical protein
MFGAGYSGGGLAGEVPKSAAMTVIGGRTIGSGVVLTPNVVLMSARPVFESRQGSA